MSKVAASFVECEDCPSSPVGSEERSVCESCHGTGLLVEPDQTGLPDLSVLYRLISWERGDKSLPDHLEILLDEVKKDIEELWADQAATAAERMQER